MKRIIWNLLYFLALVLLVYASSLASPFPKKYDSFFKEAIIFMPPGTPWQLLKAQCWQESRLDPTAIAADGGMGLCQFMPGTWNDIKSRYKLKGSPFIAKLSITACSLYMSDLYNSWSSPRSSEDRYKLALASYNAGIGNILKSQEKSGWKSDYSSIESELHKITGDRNSKITKEYVHKIFYVWYPSMLK